ncbi:hypothetical protein CCHR01_18571 [Colletotrichum chrysophilum]|uniref:Uncharacterized protein n=1 Tax=Colletotrichum chrysophilum TaxID=1836956 RepID=A0AAD8ZZW2_9PEZI|nr:hypothetical protein CCHR01_18571 [Colletotrichum chrysophilum]
MGLIVIDGCRAHAPWHPELSRFASVSLVVDDDDNDDDDDGHTSWKKEEAPQMIRIHVLASSCPAPALPSIYA